MYRCKVKFSKSLVFLAVFSYAYVQLVNSVPVQKEDVPSVTTRADPLDNDELNKESRQFFGNGGNGNFQNQNGGVGGGLFGGRATTEEEDDGEETSTIQGPGAIGVLTGLFGIGNALLKGNGVKAIESTLNFYPPSLREKAKEQLNTFLGRTTIAPLASNSTVLVTTPTTTKATTTEVTTTEDDDYDDTLSAAA